jgi:hypothetical protein
MIGHNIGFPPDSTRYSVNNCPSILTVAPPGDFSTVTSAEILLEIIINNAGITIDLSNSPTLIGKHRMT